MNKRKKTQLIIAALFAVLFVVWLFLPAEVWLKILGLASSAGGVLSMVLSYRAESEKE